MAAQVNNATPLFESAGRRKKCRDVLYAAENYDFAPDLTGNYANFKLDQY